MIAILNQQTPGKYHHFIEGVLVRTYNFKLSLFLLKPGVSRFQVFVFQTSVFSLRFPAFIFDAFVFLTFVFDAFVSRHVDTNISPHHSLDNRYQKLAPVMMSEQVGSMSAKMIPDFIVTSGMKGQRKHAVGLFHFASQGID